MAAMRSRRSAAVRSVPECQVPSSLTPEPSERGKIPYQEPIRARSRSTWRGYSAVGETWSRSGRRSRAALTESARPAARRSSTGLEGSRMIHTASLRALTPSSSRPSMASARSRTRAPSSNMSSTSMPAGTLMPASWLQVAYGSDQPSTRKRQSPGASGARDAS